MSGKTIVGLYPLTKLNGGLSRLHSADEADADADFVCSADSVYRHVTIGTPMVIFAVLTVFDDWYTIGTLLVQSW